MLLAMSAVFAAIISGQAAQAQSSQKLQISFSLEAQKGGALADRSRCL
jgi:hypothetical protein